MTWTTTGGRYGLVAPMGQAPGTSGLLVQDIANKTDRYLLSAAHVLTGLPWSEGMVGAKVFGMKTADDRDPLHIADVHGFTAFSTDSGDEGDAAIARLRIPMASAVGPIQPGGISKFISEDMGVRIYSAVRGKVFQGKVRQCQTNGLLDYLSPQGVRSSIPFRQHVECDYSSVAGDSGSPVFNVLDHVVGIHIWSDEGRSIFLPVAPLMQQFHVELPDDGALDVLDTNNRHVLARTVWGEARGESNEGLQAVASVILNRAARPGWWGDSVDSVCLHPFQFSCWNKRDPNRAKLLAVGETDTAFAECVAIEEAALASGLEDKTDGATHYHTASTMPKWAVNRAPCRIIGHHLFYNDVD
jgi:N-acetylmuramoyl-L-alanine amidase